MSSPIQESCDNEQYKCSKDAYRAKHKQSDGYKEQYLTSEWHPSIQLIFHRLKLQQSQEANNGSHLTGQKNSDWNNYAHVAA